MYIYIYIFVEKVDLSYKEIDLYKNETVIVDSCEERKIMRFYISIALIYRSRFATVLLTKKKKKQADLSI